MKPVTEQERFDNREKLAAYLDTLPADYQHFDMLAYAEGANRDDFMSRPRTTLRQCGTVACAVGHGPAAGVKPREGHRRDWGEYSDLFAGWPSSSIWNFLFHSDWVNYDNTPSGAAKRLRWINAGNPPLEVGDMSYLDGGEA